jgi:hypothetical protein
MVAPCLMQILKEKTTTGRTIKAVQQTVGRAKINPKRGNDLKEVLKLVVVTQSVRHMQ